MNKENVRYIYIYIYIYTHTNINEYYSVIKNNEKCSKISIDIIIVTEMSQTKKVKYMILYVESKF